MRRFGIGFNIDTVNASKVLAILTAPTGYHARLTYVSVTARGTLVAENLSIGVIRVSSLGTPTVTYDNLGGGNNNIAAAKYNSGNAAAACEVRGDVTASAPTLATSPIRSEGVPNSTGFRWFAQQTPVTLSPGESVAVKLLASPGAAHNLSITLEWEED